MKLGIYTANLSPQERWARMQQVGFVRYIVPVILFWAIVGLLDGLLLAYIHKPHADLHARILGGITGSGVVGIILSIFSWRSAKKKAQRAKELDDLCPDSEIR
jgi:hypothetical protein